MLDTNCRNCTMLKVKSLQNNNLVFGINVAILFQHENDYPVLKRSKGMVFYYLLEQENLLGKGYKMDTSNLFGFIVNDGIVAMMSNDAMIDYHQGKIVNCEFASLSEFVERDGCNCTVLENAPIAK